VRDFIVGCHYIDGTGELLSGGGKVVKNAAGFDYPKLFVGSRGALGFLVDVVFKVFPKPETYNTLIATYDRLSLGVTAMLKLAGAPLDIHALDLIPEHGCARLYVRVGGLTDGIAGRMQRVRAALGAGEIVEAGAAESAIWREMRELEWAYPGHSVVKIPMTPAGIAAFDAALARHADANQPVRRRYCVAGNVAFVSLAANAVPRVSALCAELHLSGRVFCGPLAGAHVGKPTQPNVFGQRVKQALDPRNIFS
jgi:glycolate oxidase FAD binding subunit